MKEISEALQAYSFNLYPLKEEYAEKTMEIAFTSNIIIHDASYIAPAVVKKTQVYTADEKLKRKLNSEYLKYVRSIKEI